LCRVHPDSRRRVSYLSYPEGKKLAPVWSLPYRVIKVLSEGKAAMVRSLLSPEVRHVHLQNARIIEAPRCSVVQEVWNEHVCREESIFDPLVRREVLEKFWEEVETPPVYHEGAQVKKKRRKITRS
jgi:hypothetical protein